MKRLLPLLAAGCMILTLSLFTGCACCGAKPLGSGANASARCACCDCDKCACTDCTCCTCQDCDCGTS